MAAISRKVSLFFMALCLLCHSCAQEENEDISPDDSDSHSGNDAYTLNDYLLQDTNTEQVPDNSYEPAICDEEEFTINRATPDILIVLDRSNSMQTNGFWDPTRNTIIDIATTYQDSVLFGLMVFPGMSCDIYDLSIPSMCDASNSVVVEAALSNSDNIRSSLLSISPCGGTPLADNLSAAHAYLSSLTDSNSKYVLVATDGGPNCNPSLDGGTCRSSCTGDDFCLQADINCLDNERTYEILDALLRDGIKSFIIGMWSAASDFDDVLSEMAEHGDTDTFFPVEDPSGLHEVIESITAAIATCEFDLNPSEAADPNKVNFYFGSEVVPMDPAGTNGWSWMDDNSIKFSGSFCDKILNGDIESISATYGCPTILI